MSLQTQGFLYLGILPGGLIIPDELIFRFESPYRAQLFSLFWIRTHTSKKLKIDL